MALIRLQEDDDAEGLFGGFMSMRGDPEMVQAGAIAARGGGGIFRCGRHRGQVASAVGGESGSARGENRAAAGGLAAGGTCDGDSGGGVRAQPDAAFVELLVVLKKRGICTSRSVRCGGFSVVTTSPSKRRAFAPANGSARMWCAPAANGSREQGLLDPHGPAGIHRLKPA